MKDDDKEFKRLIKSLKELNKYRLTIFIDEEKTYPNGVKVETVAMWMEYGKDEFDVHYPARPFFRATFDANLSKIQRVFQRQLLKVIDGEKSVKDMLEEVGKYVVRRVRNMIMTGSYEGLAASTIAVKGSDKPLIDTRLLYKSIKYQVERK